MELKRLITHFTYKIEPKPEGGFIAHATDPTVSPLEAQTREELQQKIQANIFAGLQAEFPGLNLPGDNQSHNFAFHVEAKPGGGFEIHSSDPNASPVQGSSHEEIGSYFLEKFANYVGKHAMPELMQALAAQGNSTNIKVSIRQSGMTLNTGAHTFSLGTARALTPTSPSMLNGVKETPTMSNAPAVDGSGVSGLADSPLTPEKNKFWPILRFLLTVMLLSGILYFFVLHR